MKKRIYEIAKELNVTAEEIVCWLKTHGHAKIAEDEVHQGLQQLIRQQFKKKSPVILVGSDEAAEFRTDLKGWVSAAGHYFGEGKQAEEIAKYHGATHKQCKCGEVIEKNSYCRSCSAVRSHEKYMALEAIQWEPGMQIYTDDGVFDDPVEYSEHFSEEYRDSVTDELVSPIDQEATLAEPIKPRALENWYWEDSYPEDHNGNWDELDDLIQEFNEKLEKLKPISIGPSNKRLVW